MNHYIEKSHLDGISFWIYEEHLLLKHWCDFDTNQVEVCPFLELTKLTWTLHMDELRQDGDAEIEIAKYQKYCIPNADLSKG